MPVSTRRTAPLRGSAQWTAQGERDDVSSSDSDEEGIPAETPKRSKLQAKPTLSTRQSPMKHRLEVEIGQVTSSFKRLKPSELSNVTAEQLQPRRMNDYPTPSSSRTGPEPAADDVFLLDADSVRTGIEEEDDGYVNPYLLAAVNRSCGNRKPKESPGKQLQEEANDGADGDDEISIIALDDNKEVEPDQTFQYPESPESEDLDLGVEPTNQEIPEHDIIISQINARMAGSASDAQRENEVPKLAKSAAGSGSERYVARDRQPTQVPRIDAPQNDVYEIPESPEHVTSVFTTIDPKIHVSLVPSRYNNAPQHPRRKSKLTQLYSQEQADIAVGNVSRTPALEITNPPTETRGVGESSDDPPPLSLLGPVRPLSEHASEKDAIDGTLASGNSGSEAVADEAEPEAQQGGEKNGDDDDDEYREDEEDYKEPGFNSDHEDLGGPLEIEAQFSRDIIHLGNRNHQADNNSALFDAAIDNPLLSIHLPSQSLSSANQLMKRLGWTAITKEWRENLTDKRRPRTSPGKHLVHYLLKLERFFLMVPTHPDTVGQKDFLNIHKDMLRFYFSTIDCDVEYIRSTRLPSESNATAEKQDRARTRMVEDLVRLVIPLIIRVLGEAWALGGDETDSAFTGLTVQILAKLANWLKKLYEPLLREPTTRFPKGGSGATNVKAREALGPHLRRLQNLLNETPDRFREKEEVRMRSESNRRITLRRQEEIKTRRQVEAKLREIAYIEQNRRVAQALRRTRPSPRQTPDLAHWRTEEELSLCNRLKGAYDYQPPQLPTLSTIALELGHSEKEIKNKSQDLLKVMLAQAYPQKTGRDIQDMVNELMRQWS